MKALAIALLICLSGWAHSVRAIPVLTLDSAPTAGPSADSLHGWEFSVNTPILVTDLGLWDFSLDGFAQSYDIGLFRLSDSQLLTSGTIGAGTGDFLVDNFRYVNVADTILEESESYVISYYVELSGPPHTDFVVILPDSLSIDLAISYTQARWQVDAGGLGLPGEARGLYAIGPNFLFEPAPVPATLPLIFYRSWD